MLLVLCSVTWVFLDAAQVVTVILPELTSFYRTHVASSQSSFGSVQSVIRDNVSLASLEIESIFYAVLGMCGFVLALRAVISILRALKAERLLKARASTGVGMGFPSPGSRKAATPSFPTVALEFRELDRRNTGRTSKASAAPFDVPSSLRHRHILYTHGITGKLVFIFMGTVGAFGVVTVTAIYFTLSSSLSRHVMQRARVTALNVGASAPGYLVKNNATGLRELLRRNANKAELAYILVENRAGKIFAHSFDAISQEIRGRSSSGDRTIESQRTLRFGDRVVYELAVPISEGRTGTVRVGIWREQVLAPIKETMIPLIELLALVLCGGVLMAIFLISRITRPILRLVAAAKAISSGDLDTPSPEIGDLNEFGELSRALERMRSSVKAAMVRLSR